MKSFTFRTVLGVLGLMGALWMWTSRDAEASIPAGVVAELGHAAPAELDVGALSFTVTCTPANAFNPDAGTGLVRGGGGYRSLNCEPSSTLVTTTNPVHFVWRNGTTKANYTTLAGKRCVGCDYGGSYVSNITGAFGNLFCIREASATDAGVVVGCEASGSY